MITSSQISIQGLCYWNIKVIQDAESFVQIKDRVLHEPGI